MAIEGAGAAAAFLLKYGNVGRDYESLLSETPTETQLQAAAAVARNQVDLALYFMREHHGMPQPEPPKPRPTAFRSIGMSLYGQMLFVEATVPDRVLSRIHTMFESLFRHRSENVLGRSIAPPLQQMALLTRFDNVHSLRPEWNS